ncbi:MULTISPECIES: lytic murein transglycosylase [Shewanella]|uniref:lytic murein transglycosylase n=1 Tax=Shewanella TaxID=22 RepID=UPI000490888A|nr:MULTISPECIES: lytic murein transglycosylase [Shewanella]QLE85777.1 lytic murein transglycosylase [Shewanella sp. Scap07]
MPNKFHTICMVATLSLCTLSSYANGEQFTDYLTQLQQQALDNGVSKPLLENHFSKIKRFHRAGPSNEPTTTNPKDLETYLPLAVPESMVQQARALYKIHLDELTEIGQRYQVQPRFIVALWGINSQFGQQSSSLPALSVLATRAYNASASSSIEQQVFDGFNAIAKFDLPYNQLQSNSEGLLGATGFTTTQLLQYGQDGNQDGRVDIWQSDADVFASLAYFLQQQGWKEAETWGRQVKAPTDIDTDKTGLANLASFDEWQQLGVRRFDGSDLPKRNDMQISLIMPDGTTGRHYLVYDNYRALLKWHNDDYFALAVAYLSERIKYPAIK